MERFVRVVTRLAAVQICNTITMSAAPETSQLQLNAHNSLLRIWGCFPAKLGTKLTTPGTKRIQDIQELVATLPWFGA
jgi:hypothetical protein